MAKKNKNIEEEPEKIDEPQTESPPAGEQPSDGAATASETVEAEQPVESEAAKFERELAELKDSYLRLAAEYDNFRKRTAKERDGLFASGKISAVEALLPVYDNLERAAAQPTGDEAYKKGVDMTLAQLKQSFEALGVSEIDSNAGSAFDPSKHNAVMHVEDESFGAGVIVETFQKGFEADGRVIRHAVVKVAN